MSHFILTFGGWLLFAAVVGGGLLSAAFIWRQQKRADIVAQHVRVIIHSLNGHTIERVFKIPDELGGLPMMRVGTHDYMYDADFTEKIVRTWMVFYKEEWNCLHYLRGFPQPFRPGIASVNIQELNSARDALIEAYASTAKPDDDEDDEKVIDQETQDLLKRFATEYIQWIVGAGQISTHSPMSDGLLSQWVDTSVEEKLSKAAGAAAFNWQMILPYIIAAAVGGIMVGTFLGPTFLNFASKA